MIDNIYIHRDDDWYSKHINGVYATLLNGELSDYLIDKTIDIINVIVDQIEISAFKQGYLKATDDMLNRSITKGEN